MLFSRIFFLYQYLLFNTLLKIYLLGGRKMKKPLRGWCIPIVISKQRHFSYFFVLDDMLQFDTIVLVGLESIFLYYVKYHVVKYFKSKHLISDNLGHIDRWIKCLAELKVADFYDKMVLFSVYFSKIRPG